jgi:hypothetical protein
MASNPELAQNIIGSNPLFAGNPALQEQVRSRVPLLCLLLFLSTTASIARASVVGKLGLKAGPSP